MTHTNEHDHKAEQQQNGRGDTTTETVNPQKMKLVTKLLIDNKFGLMDDLNFSRPLTASSEGVPISAKTSELGYGVPQESTREFSKPNTSNIKKYKNKSRQGENIFRLLL